MTAPTPLTIAALDVPPPVVEEQVAQLAAHLRDCRLAEYAHLLHDADPDSTTPAFPCLTKGLRAVTR